VRLPNHLFNINLICTKTGFRDKKVFLMKGKRKSIALYVSTAIICKLTQEIIQLLLKKISYEKNHSAIP
jgi:hypothetical protein